MKVRKLSLENPNFLKDVMIIDVVLDYFPESDEGSLDVPGSDLAGERDTDKPVLSGNERHCYFATIGKNDYALGTIKGCSSSEDILKDPYFLGLLMGLGAYGGSEASLHEPEHFAASTKVGMAELVFDDKDGLELPNSIEPFSEDRYSVSSKEETNDGKKYTNVIYAPKKNVIEHRIVFPDSAPKPYTPWC